MKTTIAVPKDEKSIKELKDYASKKGLSVKITRNVAVINLPEGFQDSEFDDLTLKLELAFTDELNVDIPFKIHKFPPYFAVQMDDLLLVDSMDGATEIDEEKYEEIIKKIAEKDEFEKSNFFVPKSQIEGVMKFAKEHNFDAVLSDDGLIYISIPKKDRWIFDELMQKFDIGTTDEELESGLADNDEIILIKEDE